MTSSFVLPSFAAPEAFDGSENTSPNTHAAGNAASTSGAARNDALKDASPNETEEAEEAAGLSYGGEVNFNSRYVWRGLALSRGAVIQPSAWVSARDYTLSVWGNMELSGARRFNEVDITLSRSIALKKWTLEPGVQLYLYPRASDGASTGEVSLRLSRRVGRATAYAQVALDVIRYKGAAYGEIGTSLEHEWNKRLSGEAALGLGFGSSRFNRVNIGATGAALNVATLDVSLSYALGEHLALRPHAALSTLLPNRLRNEVDDPTILVFGVALEGEY